MKKILATIALLSLAGPTLAEEDKIRALCLGRVYDAKHMHKNPNQTVASLAVLILQNSTETVGHIWIETRTSPTLWGTGQCNAVNNEMLSCNLAVGSGQFIAELHRTKNSMLVHLDRPLGSGFLELTVPHTENTFRVHGTKEDTNFRIDTVNEGVCRELLEKSSDIFKE